MVQLKTRYLFRLYYYDLQLLLAQLKLSAHVLENELLMLVFFLHLT